MKLTPEDLGRVITIDEQRAKLGLSPISTLAILGYHHVLVEECCPTCALCMRNVERVEVDRDELRRQLVLVFFCHGEHEVKRIDLSTLMIEDLSGLWPRWAFGKAPAQTLPAAVEEGQTMRCGYCLAPLDLGAAIVRCRYCNTANRTGDPHARHA